MLTATTMPPEPTNKHKVNQHPRILLKRSNQHCKHNHVYSSVATSINRNRIEKDSTYSTKQFDQHQDGAATYSVLLRLPEYKVDRLPTKVADNAEAPAANMQKPTRIQWKAEIHFFIDKEFRSEEHSNVYGDMEEDQSGVLREASFENKGGKMTCPTMRAREYSNPSARYPELGRHRALLESSI
jgi:hypothetical protein